MINILSTLTLYFIVGMGVGLLVFMAYVINVRQSLDLGTWVKIYPPRKLAEYLPERLNFTGLYGVIREISQDSEYGVLFVVWFPKLDKEYTFDITEMEKLTHKELKQIVNELREVIK